MTRLGSGRLGIALIIAVLFASLVPPGKAYASKDTGNQPALRLNSQVSGPQTNEDEKRVDHVSSETSTSAHMDRLVIIFHGVSGSGSVMQFLGEAWTSKLPATRFVAPDAPFENKDIGREWFVVDDYAMRPDRIQAARAAFDRTVAEVVKRQGFEGNLKNVAFVGYSQGAIMALDAVASGRWKVGALVSFAGLLPVPPTADSNETPVLLLHGAADNTIPSTASVQAQAQLKLAGFDATIEVFSDVAHEMSGAEVEAAGAFLRDRFVRPR